MEIEHLIYYHHTKFNLIFHEDGHTSHETIYFESRLIFIQLRYVISSYLLWKFNKQQKST
jgi:hypothetical protein